MELCKLHVGFRRLTRRRWRRLLFDRQRMINEQSKCSTRKFSTQEKNPLFKLAAFEKLAELKRSESRALRDAPLLPPSLTVNRWLPLIDGCAPTLLNANVRYQAFWPSLVNSSGCYAVSAPLCDSISSVFAHQLITSAIHLQCFYSRC